MPHEPSDQQHSACASGVTLSSACAHPVCTLCSAFPGPLRLSRLKVSITDCALQASPLPVDARPSFSGLVPPPAPLRDSGCPLVNDALPCQHVSLCNSIPGHSSFMYFKVFDVRGDDLNNSILHKVGVRKKPLYKWFSVTSLQQTRWQHRDWSGTVSRGAQESGTCTSLVGLPARALLLGDLIGPLCSRRVNCLTLESSF